ncbi:hypothetical protein ACHAXA_000362 [Cyclostephanos tholiformis]|uniref:Uncharacterized protein n=1 Tax=Cyclostephanos tholiformis TaxID=382380 RepID=A0ABD3R5H9_9STRA
MFLINKSRLAALAAALVFVDTNHRVVESFAPSSTDRSSLRNNVGDARIGTVAFDLGMVPPPRRQTHLHVTTKTTTKPKTKVNGALVSKKTNGARNVVEVVSDEESDGELSDAKKIELVLLAVWGVSISAFILINNAYGPWPLFMKHVPERVFFLSHMVGGMLFGGGIILTTLIERAVAKSNNPSVLQFWFDKVPELDGLVVVPALTISMISGTGLSIVRYGGLNIAPPHVGAIFWTLIAFMSWWAATDLTTQGTALKAVERMYERSLNGEDGLETPKVVVDRHFSNVVSCFFILTLYSMMVLKPGTLIPFPWPFNG